MAESPTGGFNPFFAPLLDNPAETYFSMWTLTDEGRRYPGKVQTTLELASNRLRDLGGRCRLYVTVGGPADLVGVAKGQPDQPLDERDILALQRAIEVSGVLRCVFFKAIEFTAIDYATYTDRVNSLTQS